MPKFSMFLTCDEPFNGNLDRNRVSIECDGLKLLFLPARTRNLLETVEFLIECESNWINVGGIAVFTRRHARENWPQMDLLDFSGIAWNLFVVSHNCAVVCFLCKTILCPGN